MPAPKKVLVTCVGSGVGQSVVDSLKHAKDAYFLIGSDQSRYCYPMPDCDDYLPLPRIDDSAYIDALLVACQDRKIDAAIPGHDLELALFARHAGRFEAVGTTAIVASERLITLLRDKHAWSKEFGARTRHVVPSCTVSEIARGGAGSAIQFPAIAKPVSGSASAGLRILRRREEAAGLPDDSIIQPFLFPASDDPELPSIRAAVDAGRIVQASEISVQLVYSRDGELLARFASRNRLKAGVPVEFHPLDTEEIWAAVGEIEAVMAEYSPRGPINLQGRMTDSGLVFFEMNPRFTGITGNRALLGFNEVALLVDNFTGGARRKLRANLNKAGVRQVACRAWPKHRFGFETASHQEAASKAIVVLGGTSWLARHFVAERAGRKDAIVVVARDASFEQASAIYAPYSTVEVLGRGSDALRDALAWADVLVNCVSGRPPLGDPNIFDAHLYQMRLLDLAETSEIPRVVNISSQSVYHSSTARRNEAATLSPCEPYAFSKLAIEEAIRGMTRRRPSLSAVSLRLARLFGPATGLRPQEFPHRVVACAVLDDELEVSNPGSTIDLLDLRDAVRALSYFVDRDVGGQRGDVFNVGSERSVTIREYVAYADRESRRRFGRPLRASIRDGGGDAPANLDCGKIAAAGWTPSISIESSIAGLFDYFVNAS